MLCVFFVSSLILLCVFCSIAGSRQQLLRQWAAGSGSQTLIQYILWRWPRFVWLYQLSLSTRLPYFAHTHTICMYRTEEFFFIFFLCFPLFLLRLFILFQYCAFPSTLPHPDSATPIILGYICARYAFLFASRCRLFAVARWRHYRAILLLCHCFVVR